MAARRVSASSLQEQANDFAASISRVVSAFTGVEHPFVATALEDRVRSGARRRGRPEALGFR